MTSGVRAASGWLGSIDDGRADVKVSRVETKGAGGGEEGGYIRLCPGPTLYLALCSLERDSSLWGVLGCNGDLGSTTGMAGLGPIRRPVFQIERKRPGTEKYSGSRTRIWAEYDSRNSQCTFSF